MKRSFHENIQKLPTNSKNALRGDFRRLRLPPPAWGNFSADEVDDDEVEDDVGEDEVGEPSLGADPEEVVLVGRIHLGR